MRPFGDRLDDARALVAALKGGAVPPLATHLCDQLGAATEDAHRLAHRLEDALRVVEPGRWHAAHNCDGGLEPSIAAEAEARILAALGACTHVCSHLRRGGPQPAWVSLALHRVDCVRCCQTIRKPPPGDADRCDFCGRHGVTTFFPLAFQRGPMVVHGDACPGCAAALEGSS